MKGALSLWSWHLAAYRGASGGEDTRFMVSFCHSGLVNWRRVWRALSRMLVHRRVSHHRSGANFRSLSEPYDSQQGAIYESGPPRRRQFRCG